MLCCVVCCVRPGMHVFTYPWSIRCAAISVWPRVCMCRFASRWTEEKFQLYLDKQRSINNKIAKTNASVKNCLSPLVALTCVCVCVCGVVLWCGLLPQPIDRVDIYTSLIWWSIYVNVQECTRFHIHCTCGHNVKYKPANGFLAYTVHIHSLTHSYRV